MPTFSCPAIDIIGFMQDAWPIKEVTSSSLSRTGYLGCFDKPGERYREGHTCCLKDIAEMPGSSTGLGRSREAVVLLPRDFLLGLLNSRTPAE